MLKWYCIHTKKGSELKALLNLNNMYNNRAFCPMMHTDKRKKQKRVIQPLWPCYVFLQLDDDLLKGDDIRPIRSTPGVQSGIVRNGLTYPTVSDEFIESLQGCTHGEAIDYRIGEQVRAITGVYAGWELKIENVTNKVIHALSGSNKITINRSDVAPI